ncbi:hypothetical protein HAX54_015854 [Datura stramonium]|uniref:Uncharacterized protein n=1 Tax=Datura stramonium TaxID=4076 RepID=A0ABS8UJS4_DATST|nr:hypothetical protein [Datura stramonium]
MTGLDQYPDILEQLHFHHGDFSTKPLGKYFQTLVQKFYASYGATLEATSNRPKSHIEALDTVIGQECRLMLPLRQSTSSILAMIMNQLTLRSMMRSQRVDIISGDGCPPHFQEVYHTKAVVKELQDRGPLIEDVGIELPAANVARPLVSLLAQSASSGPIPPRDLIKSQMEEEEWKTKEEDDPDMNAEEAAKIRIAKMESFMDKRIQPHIEKEASTLVAAVPTTATLISDVIVPPLD